jgi:ribosome-binding factor A
MRHPKSELKKRRREQKTTLVYHALASILQKLSLDEPALAKVYVTKVKMSGDYKICYVYFSTYGPKEDFDAALAILKLYKPSMRKVLATQVGGRYTSDLIFQYDTVKEKERRVQELLDEVAKETKSEQ